MDPLERLTAIAYTPTSCWPDLFPRHRLLGIYNAYVPEELFHASGYTPVYMFHRPTDKGYARSYLPSFACWPGRSLIDQAVSGDLDALRGIAFAQTCDVVQALFDLWSRAAPHIPVFFVRMPSNLATPLARDYLIVELTGLWKTLGGGSIDDVRQSLSVYQKTRALVAQVYERAADLNPTDLYSVLRAAFLMPKEQYNALLSELLDILPPSVEFEGPRLILVGPHLAEPTIYRIIEAVGARIVDDLLDIGHRYVAEPPVQQEDPIAAIADRLLNILPTPTKYQQRASRYQHLIGTVAEKQADGVIFARQKFCDPHGFEYARARVALASHGIPVLSIELEQSSQVARLGTRVQAFIETVSCRSGRERFASLRRLGQEKAK